MIHQTSKVMMATAALALCFTGAVQAQPNVNTAPAEAAAQVNDKAAQKKQQRDEREAMRKEWPRQVLRTFLTENGFTSQELQDAVIAHYEQREQLKQQINASGGKLQAAMSQTGITPAQLGVSVNEYKAALDDYQTKSAQAATALDAKIGYSKDTKLEATLLLAGVLGEGPSFVKTGAPPWAGGGNKANGAQGKGAGKNKGQTAQ